MEKATRNAVYISDAKAKVHLKSYIESRQDTNAALFVTLNAPHKRLKISGVEIRIRELGRSIDLERFIRISSVDKGQQGQLIRECRSNRCKNSRTFTN